LEKQPLAEVLNGLLEFGTRLGIRTLGELHAAVRARGRPNFGKIRLADDLPSSPGVYLFTPVHIAGSDTAMTLIRLRTLLPVARRMAPSAGASTWPTTNAAPRCSAAARRSRGSNLSPR